MRIIKTSIIIFFMAFSVAILQGQSEYQKGEFLIKATMNGNLENVKSLIATGVNVNAKASYGKYGGGTALMIASMVGYIQSSADEYKGFTALIIASTVGYIDIVKALIKAGADVNIQVSGGAGR